MKIYYIERTDDEQDWNYDEYDSAIVCASSHSEAKDICIYMFHKIPIKATVIGTANSKQKKGVAVSSFNAG